MGTPWEYTTCERGNGLVVPDNTVTKPGVQVNLLHDMDLPTESVGSIAGEKPSGFTPRANGFVHPLTRRMRWLCTWGSTGSGSLSVAMNGRPKEAAWENLFLLVNTNLIVASVKISLLLKEAVENQNFVHF